MEQRDFFVPELPHSRALLLSLLCVTSGCFWGSGCDFRMLLVIWLAQEEELKRLLEARPHPVCYDGFEPSGRMHIAQGVMRVINVNKLTK